MVAALDVADDVEVAQAGAGKAELLALVDERRTAHQVQHRAERLGRGGAMLLVPAPPADHAGLVVVAPVEAVPATVGQRVLPAGKAADHVGGGDGHGRPLVAGLVVEVDMVEREDDVHRPGLGVGDASGQVAREVGHLADAEDGFAAPGGVREDLAVQLVQVLLETGAVHELAPTVGQGHAGWGNRVGQLAGAVGDLGDEVDDVETEAVDAAVEPAAHERGHLGPDGRILPVQVGLASPEHVEVVGTGDVVPLPGRAREVRRPVGRTVLPPVPVAS